MNADYGAPTELAGPLQQRRARYQPRLPPCLQGATVRVEYGDATTTIDPTGAHAVAQAFPRTYGQRLVTFLAPDDTAGADKAVDERPPIRVGVVFSGRQSPGGHNVVWGLHDALRAYNPHSVLYGFIGGTEGLFANKTLEITNDVLASYKNQGGFDLLGRSIDQIRSSKQVSAAMTTCHDLNLDGLVIVGGTNYENPIKLVMTVHEN